MNNAAPDWSERTHPDPELQRRKRYARDLTAEQQDKEETEVFTMPDESTFGTAFKMETVDPDQSYSTKPVPGLTVLPFDQNRTNRLPGLYQGQTRPVIECADRQTFAKVQELALHGYPTMLEALEQGVGLDLIHGSPVITPAHIARAQAFIVAYKSSHPRKR